MHDSLVELAMSSTTEVCKRDAVTTNIQRTAKQKKGEMLREKMH